MDGSQDGILQLVQRLCESLLIHTPVQADRSNGGYTTTFQVSHRLPWGWDKKRKLALRHLTRTVFDLILLRKWLWFGMWGSEITPECRCLAHTYDMHLQGLHREAARLESAVSTLMGEGNPLQEKESILKFLALMSSGLHRKQAPTGLDTSQLSGVCYECYPSSLFEQLPAVEQVCELSTAMSESSELFECMPGSGFNGFFSSESLGRDKAPSASSLFDGLTHATLTDLNTPLGLPSLPSHPDAISLLNTSSKDSGIADSPVRGGGRCVWPGDTGEREEEWIDPSLLSVLMGEDGGPLLVRAWEGWDQSKSYLSEGGEETFTHASTLCLARLAPLAGITLPMDVDTRTSPRHLVAALDALPTSLLHPTQVQSDSISQAFSRLLSSLLVYCRAQLHDATDGKSDIFAQAAANNLLPLVRFLLQLLANTTSCPKGLQLLDVLYAQASRVQGTPHYPFLLSLLKQAAVPYLQFVWQWVFQGWLGTDEEFGLHADQDSLTRRDHHYWDEGYRLSSPCTPHFLTQHTHTILTCGKALNLLRMCCPTHPLCGRTVKPPRVALVVCMEDLQEIGHQCQTYTSEVTEHIQRSEQQLREEELSREREVREVAARVRQDARDAVDKIRRVERAYVEEQRKKKQALYQELTQQMRETRALRMEQEVEMRQRDRETVAALSLREEALSAEERRLQEEAKAELVAYYEELSLEAERRRMRAEWQGKRLELSRERQRFLQREREELEREEREREETGREVVAEREAPAESQRTREAVHTTQQQGRTEELGEQVVRSEEEGEGDGEGRGGGEGGRPRRTWAESEATPVGHQGRKTWVTSLIEAPITTLIDASITPVIKAPITPVIDDHLNMGSTPPSSTSMEEYGLQCEIGPGGSTLASMALDNERNAAEEFMKDLTPSTLEQPSPVAQDVSYGMESRLESGLEPGHMEPGQEAHVTPAKAREPPSIAQDIIYGRELVSPEQLERIWSQERATHTTPREDSSRGRDRPSTAQDIIYARGTTAQVIDDGMSPRLVSTRGHAPPSTVQDIMYAQGEGNLVKQSTRGQAPPSVVQDIMYADSPTPVGFTSTRGKPPPTSIQRLLYPLKAKEGEEEEVKLPQKVEEEHRFTTFQPYQDSYPMLSLPPTHDILDGLLGPTSCPLHTTDTAFLFLYPLPALVDHSITLPILTQSRLVNSALVDHFLGECHIMQHFVALKRYLLMEDGEFGHSLASRLFDELTFGHNWRHLCSASFLNPLLSAALGGSLHGHSLEAERLSFALKYQPNAVKTHSVNALEFLELRYKVDWPCNIVITGDTISRYNRVFQLLLQLKRASWTLKSVFAHLKKIDGLDEWQLRQLQIYRHEFQHFITVMQGYITNQLFHLSWGEFETELNQHVHSLDDLMQAHKNFIDKIIFRCLLSKKARPVMNIIHGIFSSVLKFGEQLTLSTFPPQRRYQAMCNTHVRDFRKAATLLITVVTKLVQRGYQPHLEDLLLRLNFNGFYMHS